MAASLCPGGVEGLTDEYRAGRPRTVSDAQVAQVIERTLNTTPKDATHWSIRSMAAEAGLSHTTIRRIWGAFGLQPHRSETFKLSSDPLFVDKSLPRRRPGCRTSSVYSRSISVASDPRGGAVRG